MECIKTVTDGKYEVSDEAYHTLKRIGPTRLMCCSRKKNM